MWVHCAFAGLIIPVPEWAHGLASPGLAAQSLVSLVDTGLYLLCGHTKQKCLLRGQACCNPLLIRLQPSVHFIAIIG